MVDCILVEDPEYSLAQIMTQLSLGTVVYVIGASHNLLFDIASNRAHLITIFTDNDDVVILPAQLQDSYTVNKLHEIVDPHNRWMWQPKPNYEITTVHITLEDERHLYLLNSKDVKVEKIKAICESHGEHGAAAVGLIRNRRIVRGKEVDPIEKISVILQ